MFYNKLITLFSVCERFLSQTSQYFASVIVLCGKLITVFGLS